MIHVFLKEAIFFCMVGLALFDKEGTGTSVCKILVRALIVVDWGLRIHGI